MPIIHLYFLTTGIFILALLNVMVPAPFFRMSRRSFTCSSFRSFSNMTFITPMIVYKTRIYLLQNVKRKRIVVSAYYDFKRTNAFRELTRLKAFWWKGFFDI